jgi:hypothetical protein
MKTAIWIIAALLLGLWSLLTWGVLTVLGLDPGWVQNAKPLIEQIPYAALIDQWIPGWQPLLLALLDLTHTLLGWLGGAGTVVVWVLWALGAAGLLLLGVVLTLVVAAAQRASRPKPQAAAA